MKETKEKGKKVWNWEIDRKIDKGGGESKGKEKERKRKKGRMRTTWRRGGGKEKIMLGWRSEKCKTDVKKNRKRRRSRKRK